MKRTTHTDRRMQWNDPASVCHEATAFPQWPQRIRNAICERMIELINAASDDEMLPDQ